MIEKYFKAYKFIGLLLMFIGQSYAGTEALRTQIYANEIDNDLVFELVDHQYFYMQQNDPQWRAEFNNLSVINKVMLGIDANYNQLVAADTMIIELEITYEDENFSTTTLSQTLELLYNPSADSISDAMDIFIFTGGHSVFIEVINVINPLPNAYLASEMHIERIYAFDPNGIVTTITASPTTSIDYSENGIGELEFAWSYLDGAEYFDLEWLWVDNVGNVDLLTGQILTSKPANAIPFDFKYNSTRISTGEQSYTIPLVFERGYILYRVRGVGKDINNPGKLIYGAWSAVDKGQVSDLTNGVYSFFDETMGEVDFAGHEQKFNWQYNANFAEEGKRKESISYFDGSLRNRQVVSKLNTEDQTIIGETFYDHQGRAAVQALSVPNVTNENDIKYYENFNLSPSGNVPYSKDNFDVEGSTDCEAAIGPMNNTSGAALYYSPNNPDQDDYQALLPNAEGYPFTHIEFTPDNTGRIRRQGGVGATYQLNSEHETKYYYGKPAQEELDPLLGSDAAWVAHYKKNLVVDANGQKSVSYLDQQGKVIITAMADEAREDLDDLPSIQTLTKNINLINGVNTTDPGNENIVNGNDIVLSREFLAVTAGNYNFEYEVTPQEFTLECLPASVCAECVYGLTLSIKDECGTELVDPTNQTRMIGSINPFDLTCNAPLPSTNIPFTLSLATGNYSITKILHIKEDAADFYANTYLEDTSNCTKSFYDFYQDRLSYVDLTACEEDCNTCNTKLGNYTDHNNINKATPGHSAYDPNYLYLTLEGYNELQKNCDKLCDEQVHPCEAAYKALLKDVSPGGQYAPFNFDQATQSYVLPDSQINLLNINNSFPNPDYDFQHPGTPYVDKNGELAMVLNAEGNLVSPDQLTLAEFIEKFDTSWAKSLVTYHPEYCYYTWCNLNTTSNDYDWTLLNQDENPSGSGDAHLWNPLDLNAGGDFPNDLPDNISNVDPFFAPGGEGADRKSEMITDMRDYYFYDNNNGTSGYFSIYEMAYLSAKCNKFKEKVDEMLNCLPSNPITIATMNDEAWAIFNGFYAKLKGKYMEEEEQQYAIVNGCYNACIGTASQEFNPCKYNFMGEDCPSCEFYNESQFCNVDQYSLYKDKAKRFPSANDGLPGSVDVYDNDADVVQCMGKEVQKQLFVECGKCPIAIQFEYFMKAVIKEKRGMIRNFIVNELEEFSTDLYESIPQPTSNPANTILYRWKVASLSGNNVIIDIVNNQNNSFKCRINMSLDPSTLMYSNGTTASWTQLIEIVSIKHKVSGSNFDFILRGKFSKLINGQRDTIEGVASGTSTCFEVGGCPNVEVCEKAAVANDFQNLLNLLLKDRNSLNVTQGLAVEPYNKIMTNNLRFAGAGNYSYSGTTSLNVLDAEIQYSGQTSCEIDMTIITPNYNFNNITDFFDIQPSSMQQATTNAFTIKAHASDGAIIELQGSAGCYNFGFDCAEYVAVEGCNVEKQLFAGTQTVYEENFNNIPDENNPPFNTFTSTLVDDCDYLCTNGFQHSFINNTNTCTFDGQTVFLGSDPSTFFHVTHASIVPPFNNTTNTSQNDFAVFEKTIVVENGCEYDFNIRSMLTYYANTCVQPFINIYFNNQSFLNIYLPSNDIGSWQNYSKIWIADNNNLTIRIELEYGLCFNGDSLENSSNTCNINYASGFALDDIKLVKTASSVVECIKNPLCDTPRTTPALNINAALACKETLLEQARYDAEQAYQYYADSVLADFQALYRKNCSNTEEIYTVNYSEKEFHYTLYSYDQAGNLIQTVPPAGVNRITDVNTLNQINNYRLDPVNNNPVDPGHTFKTNYQYNSLNQLIEQNTPDGGTTVFYYDELGRLIISQNAKQALHEPDPQYSYTQYDNLGRIIEVGEIETSTDPASLITGGSQIPYQDEFIANFLPSGTQTEVTKTTYSQPSTLFISQNNLRNRVSSVSIDNDGDDNPEYLTHYSYDIHGNVKTLVQQNPTLTAINEEFKKIDYEYDLVSGNVNFIYYQGGMPDAFHHQYCYDADNRITQVLTSKDGICWERDAKYFYYQHGPLARVEIGEDKVQAYDYAYTLQGWVKNVNSNALNPPYDPGQDGYADSTNNLNSYIAKDAYGFSLGYHNNDYTAISGNQQFLTSITALPNIGTAAPNLYNGNISHMVTSLATPILTGGAGSGSGGDEKTTQLHAYRYDQLNRIKQMKAYADFDFENNVWGATEDDRYKTNLQYDANGNILRLKRNATATNLDMDQMGYHYITGTNKLDYVEDTIINSNWMMDIENQDPGNYDYDAVGNLTADFSEDIESIDWTVYGKVKEVKRIMGSSKPDLTFEYDGNGNRIRKIVKSDPTDPLTWITTNYVRDASGNILATYRGDAPAGTYEVNEHMIYGSSRVGVKKQRAASSKLTRGDKSYELTNHLGNVLAVVTDKKLAIISQTEICSSLSFDGNDDYVRVPYAPNQNLGTGNFTIEAWIKADSATTTPYGIINNIDGGNLGYKIFVNPISSTIGVQISESTVITGATYIKDNSWHHIALVRSGIDVTLYIDGSIDGSTISSTDLTSTEDIIIGSFNTNGFVPFLGGIDEVRIWNIERSQTEIQNSMSTKLTGAEIGLLAYWNFEEGSGQVVQDLSPNGFDGTLGLSSAVENNDPTWTTDGQACILNLSYAPDIVSTQNYYPFGMLMPTCETPIESYLATMEDDREEIERAQFYESYDSINITAMSQMNHTDSLDKLKVLALDKDGSAAQGLRKTVPVLKGDSIVMQAYAKFLPNLSKDKSKEMSLPIMAILAPLTYLTPIGEYGMQVAKLIPPILNLPLPLLGGDSYEGTPTAYLNYRLYNKDSVLIDSAQIAVSEEAMDGAKPSGKAKRDTLDDTHDHLMLTKGIKEDGYIEVYLSNTSDQEYRVYFDDYQITRMENALCEADELRYPFGFNGKENLNEVYSTTGGVVDLGERWLDTRLGRTPTSDDMARMYPDQSPYAYVFNTPIQATDPDGNVVIFINGFNGGSGGNPSYWGGFDKQVQQVIGDYSARYYDGSSGGIGSTTFNALEGLIEGGIAGSFFGNPILGAVGGTLFELSANSNVNSIKRIQAGKAMGQAQAAEIFDNLSEGETIKIVTHSMGTAYSRGFVQALSEYAESQGIEKFQLEYQIDLAAFQGSSLPKPTEVKQLDFKSGDIDNVANGILGRLIGGTGSSNIPGGRKLKVAKGTGHGIGEFTTGDIPTLNRGNSRALKTFLNTRETTIDFQENNPGLVLIIVCFSMLFSSCRRNERQKQKLQEMRESIPDVMGEAEKRRDSMLLAFTFNQFINKDYYELHYLHQYRKKGYQVNIYVDDIFYSPDSLKLFAFIIVEMPTAAEWNQNSLEDSTKQWYYASYDWIGFRENTNEIWKLYPFHKNRSNGYATYETVQFNLRDYYFDEIKDAIHFKTNCSLVDTCFWTEEKIWKKAEFVEGYYDFQIAPGYYDYQIKGKEEWFKKQWNTRPLSEFLLPIPDVEYPEELLKKY